LRRHIAIISRRTEHARDGQQRGRWLSLLNRNRCACEGHGYTPPIEPGGQFAVGGVVVTTNVVLPFLTSDAWITPEAAAKTGTGS
jgi:hypothetical protein